MTARTPYYFEVYKDAVGEFRWRFLAPNGRKMADSGQGYKAKVSAVDGINEICAQAIGGVSIVYHANAA